MSKASKLSIAVMVCSIVIACIILAVTVGNKTYNPLTMEETETGTVVTADHADRKSSAVIYVSVADGKSIHAEATLEKNSSMKIEVYPMEITMGTAPVQTIEFKTSEQAEDITLPDGDYTFQVTASRDATGKLVVYNIQ